MLFRHHPIHSRLRYLAYGLIYYFVAVIILINISLTSQPRIHLQILISNREKTTDPSTRLMVRSQTSAITPRKTVDTLKNNADLADKSERFYRLRPARVNFFVYDAVIRPDVVCTSDTYMIILVHSFHPNFAKRTAIRETWGSMASRPGRGEASVWPLDGKRLGCKIRLLFILGIHKDPGLNDEVWEESKKHDDIVQGNFLDSYRNMTLKSLLGLKVVQQYCGSSKFLLKSDDDMFIHLPYLVATLESKPMYRTILGPLNVNSKVYRNGKWKLTQEEFPFDLFPPYESGSAYVISADLWEPLLEASEYVPWIHIDDVYITGILGKILNVTHGKVPGFAFWNSRVTPVCDIVKNKVFSSTKMTPDILKNIWTQLSNHPVC